MKKRKGSLLHRMMAVLLSAVLMTGMVWDAVSMTVFAQESVSGNSAETAEGDIVPEEGTEPGTVSGNDAEPQSVMRAAVPAPQADNIASGEGWALGADGRLTITSDNGMTGWIASRDTIHNGTPYRLLVTSAEITGVTGIRKDAFLGCSNLTGSITLPEGVTSIGENAFGNCPKLTGITIPGNVTDIGKSAFAGCAGLTGITIPGSVTSIGESAFGACEGLTSITIPDTVTSMGNGMFMGCSGLTSVSLPNNMASIGNYMFCDCHSLTSVTIPQNVTAIGERAFFGCKRLQEITVPGTVTQIGRDAFEECASLESITFLSDTPPTLGDYVFGYDYSYGGTNESGKDARCGFVKGGQQGIHVPDGKAETYKTAADKGWDKWAAYIADNTQTPPAEEHKHNDVTFTPWTATDSLPTAAGNYYLTEDVTLSATWNVPGETTLCLNGKTISASGTDKYRVITIPESRTLNLYDCQNAGNITGGKSGGVRNLGTFYMYGGKISGNNAAYGSGGVYNGTTFYMYGGEISGNTAENGVGGVETYGKFYMYGGKIRNNERNSDGETGGGGVCMNAVGSFTVGGSAVISENTCNGKEDNVYLSDSFGNRWLITIDSSNPLSNSANIGVTSQAAPTDGNPVNITGANGADYSSFFTSDNADYKIVNGENNVVQLAVKASPDTQPPTGEIEIATGALTSASWTEFLAPDQVTFNLFFKDRKWVTIASGDEGGSGVYGTHYYVSNDALTKAQVEALDADAWTADATVILEPEPDRKCIVYAKITDGAGNVTYLSSDGLVFDTTPPVISGVTNGETYTAPQTVTVTDAMSGVKRVTVDGTEVTLTDNQFTLGTADGSQTVVAVDQAGNTAAVAVTVQAQTQSYALTVRNGTGTGIYGAGDTVSITANEPESGKQFDKWTVNRGGVTLADSTSRTTTFTMPERDVEVEATYKDITEEHTHNYGDWQHDDTQHWKACSCGAETDRGNHNFGDWVTDREATATEAGTKHKECRTCHYRVTETIPATGGDPGSGTVTPEVKPGTNAPATNISTPTEELKDMLLTDDEKQQVQNGTNVRIVLEVQDAGSSVSAEDKENINQALNGFTVGKHLNIDLYKLVGANRTDITETAKKIRIVITVPDSLKNTGSNKTRTFAVIRVHDGRAELLTDLDSSADTVTIETDRFSTYAIVYKDSSNGGNGGNGGNNGGGNNGGGDNSGDTGDNNGDNNGTKPDSSKDNEPKTGDATPIELYATLAMIASFAYLLLYFTDPKRGMSEETKKELVFRLVRWAKQGGRIRKCLALAAIFVLLVYYHSIGKKTCVEWKEIYGE